MPAVNLASSITKSVAEVIGTVTSKEAVKRLYAASLYRNAVYLLLNSGLSSILGFVFWIIAARLYPAQSVGLSSAAISAASLMAIIANLGLGQSLIRFLSQSGENAKRLLNSCYTVAGLASLVSALIFLGGVGWWSPALLVLRERPGFFATFVVFTVAFNMLALVGDTFVAGRRAGFTLANGLIHGLLKLPLAIAFAWLFSDFGIFLSWTLSLTVALLFGLVLFLPRVVPGYRPRLMVDKTAIGRIAQFSFANYVATFLLSAPGYLLPLIIVNRLSAEATAYFYTASLAGNMLATVAGAAAVSMFAESSNDERRLGIHLRQSLKATFIILVPAVAVIMIFAGKLLLLFGKAYSESGVTLLRLLALAVLPLAINQIYLATKKVEKKLTVIIVFATITAAITVGLSYALLPRLGVTSVGVATLASQGTAALVIGVLWFKNRMKG